MNRITKSDITKSLNKLKTHGWDVYTFNHNKRMPKGSTGFTDHVLCNYINGYVVFIEVKLYKDEPSDTQKEAHKRFKETADKNPYFLFFLLTENNYHEIIQQLLELR